MRRRRKRKPDISVGMAILVICTLFGMLFFINKEGGIGGYIKHSADNLGSVATLFQTPGLYIVSETEDNSFMEMMENRLLSRYPLYLCSMEEKSRNTYGESALLEEMILQKEATDEEHESDAPQQDADAQEPEQEVQEPEEEVGQEGWSGDLVADEEEMYPLSSIKDYELALDTFYQVDSTTMLGEELLKVEEFLLKDMTLSDTSSGPKILIYHTHSQEGYAGSDKTVVDVGEVLTDLLVKKYGLTVLHHKGEYDVGGRDYAYSNALPELIQILEENPSIEVIIDLHRDGVAEDLHLVTTIDGKPVAKLMFFNGVSQTRKNGKISYLENPNLEDNLAFSFQMQLAARTYYPTLTRDIYIKGYRYNMHLLPKSMLVEVGAQTNTYEEACNAMTYLAEILYRVLTTKR